MIFNDGSILQGWWQDNKPHGKCRNILANGTIKEGMFVDWEFTGPLEKKVRTPKVVEVVELPKGLEKGKVNQLIQEANDDLQDSQNDYDRENDEDLSSLKSHDIPRIDSGKLDKLIKEVREEADALPALTANDYRELQEIQDEDDKFSQEEHEK